MKNSGRDSGFSLLQELILQAEFRTHLSAKLHKLERMISAITGTFDSSDLARPLSMRDRTRRNNSDRSSEVTKHCLALLIKTNTAFTIGQICSELQPSVKFSSTQDPLRLVTESLHQLAMHDLVIPVEQGGIRRWAWNGNQVRRCEQEAVPLSNQAFVARAPRSKRANKRQGEVAAVSSKS
jgi:hypothetical protein